MLLQLSNPLSTQWSIPTKPSCFTIIMVPQIGVIVYVHIIGQMLSRFDKFCWQPQLSRREDLYKSSIKPDGTNLVFIHSHREISKTAKICDMAMEKTITWFMWPDSAMQEI
ncbi:hypothetical protein BS17DRAFT_869533 [Gyrodon lividus]|nr:hypothetical protein BS17DRAFT_869533 [Gyrodon lividus]